MNEGAADPDGRFYCGSMAYDTRAGAAALDRLDPDGSVAVLLEGVTISNGLDWSPNGSQAYYNDTPTRRTDVFDYDIDAGLTGGASSRGSTGTRTVSSSTPRAASGSRCTAVVRSNGSLLTGSLDAVVELPVTKVTGCTFGGPRLDELFITTSREGLAPGDEPRAGSLFRVAPGVRGVPVGEFGG